MNREVKLLSAEGNFAIVHLADRRFPGVLIQGDTFHNLISQLIIFKESYEKNSPEWHQLQELLEPLELVEKQYENDCNKFGLGLPYAKP